MKWELNGWIAANARLRLSTMTLWYKARPCAGIPFVIINSLCGCLVAYGLAGLRLTVHSLLLNLVITALQSMISIQLQVTFLHCPGPHCLVFSRSSELSCRCKPGLNCCPYEELAL